MTHFRLVPMSSVVRIGLAQRHTEPQPTAAFLRLDPRTRGDKRVMRVRSA